MTDGQTLLYRTLPAEAGGPKKLGALSKVKLYTTKTIFVLGYKLFFTGI